MKTITTNYQVKTKDEICVWDLRNDDTGFFVAISDETKKDIWYLDFDKTTKVNDWTNIENGNIDTVSSYLLSDIIFDMMYTGYTVYRFDTKGELLMLGLRTAIPTLKTK